MRKLALLVVALVVLASCGKEKKEVKINVDTIKTEVKKDVKKIEAVVADNTSKGKEVFTAKGCVACHQVDKKVIGPSLQDIAKTYTDKKGNMADFLKGKANAIVDTNPAQVAIMKANITGILKDMSTDDIHALTAYIRSTGK